jgi:hypothetical protein
MTGRRNDLALRASFDPRMPGFPGSSTDFGPLKRDFRSPLNIPDREPRFVSQQNWSLMSETRTPTTFNSTPNDGATAWIALN